MGVRVRSVLFGWLAVMVLAGVSLAQDRPPVPSGPALKAAEKAVAQLYKEQAADKTPDGRRQLAERLRTDLDETTLSADERYAMLALLLQVSKELFDVDAAFKVIDEIESLYADADAPRMKATVVSSLAGKVPAGQAATLAAKGLELIEGCIDRRDLDGAHKLLDDVEVVMARVADAGLASRLAKVQPDIDEFLKARAALETLKSKPDDPKANHLAGVYYALHLGDFDAGLPLLRKGSNPKLQELATAEAAAPADGAARMELGARWAQFGKTQDGRYKQSALKRARDWYERASTVLEGTEKLAAQRELEALDLVLVPEDVAQKPLRAASLSRRPVAAGKTRAALDAGFDWLRRHQDDSGSWSGAGCATHCPSDRPCQPETALEKGVYSSQADVGMTALALLVYLRAGFVPAAADGAVVPGRPSGPNDSVRRALTWLVAQQQPDGSFTTENWFFLYNEAIATLALAEAYGLTQDEQWKLPAQKAVDFICKAQKRSPSSEDQLWGWRYLPFGVVFKQKGYVNLPSDADMSVTGWMVMALKAAALSGLAVPEASLEGAREYTRWSTGKGGLVGYTGPDVAGEPIVGEHDNFVYHPGTMSSIGMCVRIALDQDLKEPFLLEAGEVLLHDLPAADTNPDEPLRDYYFWYYGSLALNQIDGPDAAKRTGKHWAPWNKTVTERLLALQDQTKNPCSRGGWMAPDRWSYGFGPVYTTAMNLLTLEVCYRY